MVVDGGFAYITGFATASIYGQPFYGGSMDAVLIKLYLTNSSVSWVRTVGGTGTDFGGTERSSLTSASNADALAVSAEFDLVMFPFDFDSPNIPGLPAAATLDVAIAVYSRNGTFIKYMLEYDDPSYHFQTTMEYSNVTKSFYFASTMQIGLALYQITAKNLTSKLIQLTSTF